MKNILRIALLVATPVLVLLGLSQHDKTSSVLFISGQGTGAFSSTRTANGAVESLLSYLKMRRYHEAYSLIGNTDKVDEREFKADVSGLYGSLRTYSALEDFEYHVLRQSGNDAVARVTLTWSTPLGAFYETRDLKLANRGDGWKVLWPEVKLPQVPPQVIAVNYPQWNVLGYSATDPPAPDEKPLQARVTALKTAAYGNSVVVMGEVRNENSVPVFVTLDAGVVGNDGSNLALENSFHRMAHVLLPNESTPFRMDFANVKLADVRKVQVQPHASLVTASGDPAITVSHQRMEVDARGRHVLAGDLTNESGQVVNIPHVIAAWYNKSGELIWVADGFIEKALMPRTPTPFAVDIPDEFAPEAQNYRVVVNEFTAESG